jgi:hypothetical protein
VPGGHRHRCPLTLLGCGLKVALQAARLFGSHRQRESDQAFELVAAPLALSGGEQPDDSALARHLVGGPAGEPAARSPRLQRSGQPQQQRRHASRAEMASPSAAIVASMLPRVAMSTSGASRYPGPHVPRWLRDQEGECHHVRAAHDPRPPAPPSCRCPGRQAAEQDDTDRGEQCAEAATMPRAEVSWSSGAIRWTIIPITMIAGAEQRHEELLCNGAGAAPAS